MNFSSSLNEGVELERERKRARVLCLVAVAAILIATLWPFDFFPRNGVSWLQGTSGLKFQGAGVLLSDEPLRPPETQGTESYSVELLLRPTTPKPKSGRAILAFYDSTRAKHLALMQYDSGLVVTRDAAVHSDPTKTIKFDVDHLFTPGTLVLVTISSGPNGTTVYQNGRRVGLFPGFKIARCDLSGTIVIGTSPQQYAPWSGELRGLAIYSRELTPSEALRHWAEWSNASQPPDLASVIVRYAFAEKGGREVRNLLGSGPRLEMPISFSVPYKGFLRSVQKDFKVNRTYAKDVLVNIAGFVPLGLIICAYLADVKKRWLAILNAALACGVLSLIIEVLQYYVPGRGSGVTDVLTNTLGAALGAALMQNRTVRRTLARTKLIRAEFQQSCT